MAGYYFMLSLLRCVSVPVSFAPLFSIAPTSLAVAAVSAYALSSTVFVVHLFHCLAFLPCMSCIPSVTPSSRSSCAHTCVSVNIYMRVYVGRLFCLLLTLHTELTQCGASSFFFFVNSSIQCTTHSSHTQAHTLKYNMLSFALASDALESQCALSLTASDALLWLCFCLRLCRSFTSEDRLWLPFCLPAHLIHIHIHPKRRLA